jgi:hypothetical protein
MKVKTMASAARAAAAIAIMFWLPPCVSARAPALIVLEATGRFEITWPLLWRAGAFRSPWSNHARSVISPAPPAGSPRNHK